MLLSWSFVWRGQGFVWTCVVCIYGHFQVVASSALRLGYVKRHRMPHLRMQP